MTSNDHFQIAALLGRHYAYIELHREPPDLVEAIAGALSTSNPAFDRSKFLNAVGTMQAAEVERLQKGKL